MTDPKPEPLTPNQVSVAKTMCGDGFWWDRLIATIEAAWAERDAARKEQEDGIHAYEVCDSQRRKAEAALSEANLRYTKAVTDLQAEVAALKDMRAKCESDAYAILEQERDQARADLAKHEAREVEYLDTTHRLEQERDKALADGARMREYASVFMSALGKISMCNRANGRCLSYPATCLGCRVTEFLFETPNDWLKRHDAEVLKGAADWLEAEGDYILLQCGKNHKYPENPGCCHAHLRECFAQALRERAAEERKA